MDVTIYETLGRKEWRFVNCEVVRRNTCYMVWKLDESGVRDEFIGYFPITCAIINWANA
jgi:hypothetical protein